MGSSGGSSSGDNTIRYAPYIEDHHKAFLDISKGYLDSHQADTNNPYSSAFMAAHATAPDAVDWMDAFYGSGYTISSFPSLYDMFGKFMAGLDVEVLWEQVLDHTTDNAIISAYTNAHAAILDERLTDEVLPRLKTGIRDINSVMSSSYLMAISNVEAKQNHDVAHFDAELRYKLIPIAAERWLRHLNWNNDVIRQYAEVIKFSLVAEMDEDNHNYKNRLAYIMWPWTLLEQHRANLGALQGARTSKAGEPSQAQSAIGGAVTGAAAGYMVGGPTGAVVGGVLGLASSFF